MGFYTVADSRGPVTLCEDCALMVTNEAYLALGVPVAQTMAEAAIVEASLQAMAGKTDETFSYSSYGTCANPQCSNRKEEG